MIRRSVFLAGGGAAAVAAALPRAGAAQTTTLRLAGVFADSFAMPYYAKEAGTFAQAGFTVEVSSLVNAGALAAAIGGGSVDLGAGDLVSGINAIVAGVPILLVAGGALYQSTAKPNPYILAALKDAPINSPHDFIGKTIAVPTLVGLTTACVRAWLPLHGVSLDQVKIIEFPQTAVVQGLQRGTFDIALVAEPFLTFFKNDIKDVAHPLDAIAPEFMATVWYASKALMEADRTRAHRIVQAIYATDRWANTHHDETFAVLVRDGKLDADKLRGMTRSVYATTLTPALVQPVLDAGAKAKIYDRQLDANTLISRF